MINITIEGPQGAGKSTQTNTIINANMPANVVNALDDLDTALTDFYDNPPVFGTNFVIVEVASEAALKSAKRKVNEWRRKVDNKLIGMFEIQAPL